MAIQKGDINPATGQAYAVNPASGVWDDTYWSEVVEPGLQGRGGSAAGPDLSQVPSALEFAQGLSASEDVILQALTQRMAEREAPLSIYTRLEEEAGLPGLRQTSKSLAEQIGKTEDYLEQIEPNVSARTRESLMTEAQRERLVGAERLPFLQQLGKLGTSFGRVQNAIVEALQGIGTKTELAVRGQEMDIEPFKLRFQAIVDRNSRLFSGFTVDRQTQLDALFAKWERQNQLDDQEWQLAQDLAADEKSYRRELQGAAAEAGVKLTGGESNDELLKLLGNAAAEEIAYERRPKGATGTERAQLSAEQSIRREAQEGVAYAEVIRRYADSVPVYRIREIYSDVTQSTPAMTAEEEQLLTLTPLEAKELSESEEGEAERVQRLIDKGYSAEDAKNYVKEGVDLFL